MAKKKGKSLGAWAFLIGVILAIVLGLFPSQTWILTVLVVVGILVGLLNVTGTESRGFLLASLALVIVSAMGGSAISALGGIPLGEYLGFILNNLLILFVPATIIVALKSVFDIAKD